ncbi:MAG: phage late control D family protein, partial [Acidobacteria bacterium]
MEITALEEKHGSFYAPSFQIKVNGKDLLSSEKLEIATVQIDNTLQGADQFSFTINGGFDFALREFSHLELFKIGAPVEIRMGYGDAKKLQLMLRGFITSVKTSFPSGGLPNLVVSGYDSSYCMTKGKKSRNWEDKKDSDVAALVAGEHNLKVTVQDSQVVHPKIEQNQETDRAFLEKLAKRNKFELYSFSDELYFREPASKESEVVTLEWGKGLVSFSPELNIAEQVSQVEVRGWNVNEKKAIVGTAKKGDELGRDPGRKSGSELLETLCKSAVLRVRNPVYSQQEADRIAKAILKTRSEDLVKGSGESIGLPEIRADRNIKLLGLGKLFSKTYYVEQTTHTVSTSGYTTSFRVKETT